MFKKKSTCQVVSTFLALTVLLPLGGCVSGPPLPQVNLSEPGWSVRQGQAVWRANKDAGDIAGEILMATNTSNRVVIQFTKTPFPFVIAQTVGNTWQIESPAQNRRFSGRGSPPGRIIWFHLPATASGAVLPPPWHWETSGNNWTLRNRSTGESLEGYFEASPR